MNPLSLRCPAFWATLYSLFSINAWAATIPVQVGANNQLAFSPNNFTAAKGDVVIFQFAPSIPHSVVQSTFDNPCTRSGFDSGIHTGPFTYNYTVDDTDPYWLFCIVDGHCKAGMVAAINPPTSGNQTFAAFVAKAEGTTLPSTSQGSTSNPSTRTGSSATSTGGAVSTGTPGTSHSSSPSTTSRGGSASRTVPMAGIANIGAGALVASVLMIVGAVVVL